MYVNKKKSRKSENQDLMIPKYIHGKYQKISYSRKEVVNVNVNSLTRVYMSGGRI